nr:MAG TPA: Potassium channel toxin kappa-KTX3.1/ALPHA MOTIF, ALPHA SCORPION TOXIN [Caudoviricetes sp.]
MNRVLINYCYMWCRTNVSIASGHTSHSSEPTGERVPGYHW